jgi:hypothetical protein
MTEARCNFCGKHFRNRQAVRAHLRSCPAYRHAPKAAVPSLGSLPETSGRRSTYQGLLPNPKSAEPAGADGSSLGGRIQAERERLELRRLKDANRELEAKAQRREQAELARMLAEQAEREAAQRRARADAAAQADQERRRRSGKKLTRSGSERASDSPKRRWRLSPGSASGIGWRFSGRLPRPLRRPATPSPSTRSSIAPSASRCGCSSRLGPPSRSEHRGPR